MKKKGKGKRELVIKGKEVMSTAHFSSIKHAQKRRWLSALAECGRIRESERITGIHASMHYIWMRNDEEFAVAVDEAKAISADHAEGEIHRRAFEGFDKPVIHKGKIKAWYKDYSDLLAIFWMKGAKPEKYRDNLVGLTSGCPVAIQINLGPQQQSEPKSEEKPSPEND